MADSSILYKRAMQSYKNRDLAAAEQDLRKILESKPNHARSLHLMAMIGHDVKKYDFAEAIIRMALAEESDVADFHYTLGRILIKKGKIEEALTSFQTAAEIDPKHMDSFMAAAQIYRDAGAQQRNDTLLDAALETYKHALALRPDEDVFFNIIYINELKRNYREVIETGKTCLKRYPKSVRTILAIATYHDYFHEYEQALEYFDKALHIEPNGENYAYKASTLKKLGRLDEAIAMQKKALALLPGSPWIFSNLLLAMVYCASVSQEELAATARRFGSEFADKLRRKRPFPNDRNPDRKLRIGYVSADFNTHVIDFFLSPVYLCDKSQFEIFAYSKTDSEDETTANVKKHFDHWRDIKFTDDDAAADLIEADRIDILVDLSGHTGKNGLMIFARKPAPVQVTWLGYPATTGMQAMDYRITDSHAEPLGMTEQLNVETLWRLPDIFCAYRANENSPAVAEAPPFESNGHITFGCFNNFSKVSDAALSAWAQIMALVPEARLLLEIGGIESAKIRADIQERLKASGLPIDRVLLEPRSSANRYILYNKIDIALDPFPCVGGTTSMDTLWMGVPFVSLAGQEFRARMGVSILQNAGMPELIAQNIEEYVSKAVKLAQDREALRTIRHGLRERFAASSAMNEERFARNMESAYREMWKIWCQTDHADM